MLTSPTAFSDYHQRMGVETHAIIKLTDGVTTWLFSDTEMQLTDGHVYSILSGISGIQSSVDIMSRRWAVNDVRINLINKEYRIDATDGAVRFADEMDGIYTKAIEIYYLAGQEVAALSDCLLVFDGVITDPPEYDSNIIQIRGRDKGIVVNKILPQKLLIDEFADAPGDLKDERIPLVYGDFTFDKDDPISGRGMARGLRTEQNINPKIVFSDHVLNAITEMYLRPVGQYPYFYLTPTLTEDDSGFGTGTGTDETVWGLFTPANENQYTYTLNTTYITDPENAYDLSDSTYAIVRDSIDAFPEIWGEATFGFSDEVENELLSVADHNNDDIGTVTTFKIRYKATAILGTIDSGFARLYYDTPSGSIFNGSPVIDGTFNEVTLSGGTYTHNNKDERYVIYLAFGETGGVSGDNIVNNQQIYRLYDIKLIASYKLPAGEGVARPLNSSGRSIDEDIGWAVCLGREYGSWITDGGRSVGSLSPGDAIRLSSFFIESILRDELGLATADIDTDSFDDAYDPLYVARLNVVEEDNAFNIIRTLCEQGNYAFTYSGAGKAKMIPLDEITNTTDRIINMSHIASRGDGSPDVKVSKLRVYCNDLDVKSRWQGEYDLYRDNDNYTDSTSITNYGTIKRTFSWKSVEGSPLIVLTNFLIASDGLWSRPHTEIELNTAGMTNSDLDLGDWIELDPLLDHHLLVYGASWSGKQFLVTSLLKTEKGTKIKAIEL